MASAWRSSSATPGSTTIAVFERTEGIGGTWEPQPLPGLRLRHPKRAVLVLVRAEPRLDPALRHPARDPRLPRTRGRRLRHPAHDPVRPHRRRRPLGRHHPRVDRPLRVGRHPHRRRADQCPGDVQRPQLPRHRGPRVLRRYLVPLCPVELGPRPHRRARRGDRLGGERRPVHPPDRTGCRTAHGVPAHGELGASERGRPLHPRAARGSPPRPVDRRRPTPGAVGPGRDGHGVHRRGRPRRSRAHRPGRHRRRRRPRRAGQAPPDAPVGLQASAVRQRLLPDLQPAQRRAGHRRDPAHHPGRCGHRRRHRARRRHPRDRHRVRGQPLPLVHRRRRPRRDRDRRRLVRWRPGLLRG